MNASSTSDVVDRFGDVIGQPRAVEQLRAALANPVHAYLFVGPPGAGKRAAARAFAASLLDGDERTTRLVLAEQHPDLVVVERVGAAITADQAREVVALAARAPVEGARKVLVLDEFHLLQQPAAATLLKTIEEPTESTTFLVLADDVPPELVTIASRCVRVEFGPVPDDVLTAALEAEGAAPETAALAATAARGNIDRARLLVRDPALAARHHSWYSVPARLDGTGATVAALVDELVESIDDAAAPLVERHKVEMAALEERAKQFGERGAGRRTTEERQRRELRRHRTDELKAGLATLASAYRDRAIAGERTADAFRAVAAIHEAVEAMERNPNETLLMQALLLKLSS